MASGRRPQFTFSCCVRGYQYHGKQKDWIPAVGEKLSVEIESDNPRDQNAIAVHNNQHHVGYLPKEISSTIAEMIRKGGRVACKVREPARIRRGIRSGNGAEVPIQVTITVDQSNARMLKRCEEQISTLYKEPVLTVPTSNEKSGMLAACYDSVWYMYHIHRFTIDFLIAMSSQELSTTIAECGGK